MWYNLTNTAISNNYSKDSISFRALTVGLGLIVSYRYGRKAAFVLTHIHLQIPLPDMLNELVIGHGHEQSMYMLSIMYILPM